MALRDDLLPVADAARAIAGELGFRRYQVWVRKTVSAGSRVGLGATTVTETRLLVGGQDPRVREVRSNVEVAGSPELMGAEYEIGPLTPEFAGGGIAESTINPEYDGSATAIHFVLKGPGLPASGLLCKKTRQDMDRPLRMMLRVQSTGVAG